MTRNYIFFLLPLMGDSFSNICTSLYIYWVIEIELDTYEEEKGSSLCCVCTRCRPQHLTWQVEQQHTHTSKYKSRKLSIYQEFVVLNHI